MFIVGIDPGLKGGIAFYNPERDTNKLLAYRTPTVKVPFVKRGKKTTRDDMDLAGCVDLLLRYSIAHAYLEQVSAMPGQGVTGMFRFGQNLGQWQGLLTGMRIDHTLVRPQVWKKHAGLIKAEKGDSVVLARETWPEHADLFKYKTADEGRAEASLIAFYGWGKHHEAAA